MAAVRNCHVGDDTVQLHTHVSCTDYMQSAIEPKYRSGSQTNARNRRADGAPVGRIAEDRLPDPKQGCF